MAPRAARTSRALAAAAALAVLLVACSQSSGGSTAPRPSGPERLQGTIGKAAYLIEVPAQWNGTLFLWSHGYVAPGSANPAQDAPVDQARTWMLGHGYAIAGSSYSSTGWALEDAFRDQIALLDFFTAHVAAPARVVAWGASLGGIVTAGLVQLHPDRFAGALPLCGVLSGGVATWNSELDAAYAFKTLLAPASTLELTHITDPDANRLLAMSLFQTASQTAQGRARLALVAALIDLPGWFDPRRPEPAPTDYAARLTAQMQWESQVDFRFAFAYRSELEHRAGGNPSWNAGVDYRALLTASPDRAEVVALYRAARLDLAGDLGQLDAAANIRPDAAASAYLAQNISFDGALSVPVLTVHTTGDGLVIPPNESAYSAVVSSAGASSMLRQLFVHRAGHCAFSPAEIVAAVEQLVHRMDTGSWDDPALTPAALNGAAIAEGADASTLLGFRLDPSFIAYQPAAYPRPFAKGAAIPA
jgi:hypothetical protein